MQGAPCPNSFSPPTHSFIIPLSPSPVLFLLLFLSQRPKTHFLPLILLARLPLAVCLDLCALHIAAYPSTVAVCWKLVYLQLPLVHASPLSVTVNRPTNSTCKPPSRCCLLYYDNLRPAWDIFKTKVNLFRICRFGATALTNLPFDNLPLPKPTHIHLNFRNTRL